MVNRERLDVKCDGLPLILHASDKTALSQTALRSGGPSAIILLDSQKAMTVSCIGVNDEEAWRATHL